ncbi:MAG: hypothetical protein FK732_09930 [Asgard group archaeon]|nr:hypothetical protein [Asgard group archaeon]
MTHYNFYGIADDELDNEMTNFFSTNKFKTKTLDKGHYHFQKGNAWALIPQGFIDIGNLRGFLVVGRLRIQKSKDYNSCTIIFDRTRVWLVNLIWSLLYLVSIITMSAMDIYPNVRTGLLIGLLVIVFFQLWIVNAAEKLFLKKFEEHFKKYF